MIRKSIFITITMVVFLSMTTGSYAQVEPLDILIPNLINYQGQLVQKDPIQPNRPSIPVTGTYTITFRLYDVETGGVAVWEEMQNDVVVKVGIFNVILGKNVPLNIRFDDPDKIYWLAMQVMGDNEMSPRQKIASNAHSFMSQDSYSLNGFASGANNGLIADKVDDIHASSTPAANKLLALDGEEKFPNSVLNMGHEKGINADMLDGVHYSAISTMITDVDNKVSNHINNDQVTSASGNYPSMSVGYASSAGSASSAGNADTVDGKHADELGGSPYEAHHKTFMIKSSEGRTCAQVCESKNLLCYPYYWAEDDCVYPFGHWADYGCDHVFPPSDCFFISCDCYDHAW